MRLISKAMKPKSTFRDLLMGFIWFGWSPAMAFNCGASIPAKVVRHLVAAGDDPRDQAKAGMEYACEQLVDLAANGVDGIHIYSMNHFEIGRAAHAALAECGYLDAAK